MPMSSANACGFAKLPARIVDKQNYIHASVPPWRLAPSNGLISYVYLGAVVLIPVATLKVYAS